MSFHARDIQPIARLFSENGENMGLRENFLIWDDIKTRGMDHNDFIQYTLSGNYDAGDHTPYALSEENDKKEQKKKEERLTRSAVSQVIASIDTLQKAYDFASSALSETMKWNGHAVNLLPGAQKAAAEARNEADEKFAKAEGKTVTAVNEKGERVHVSLNEHGLYVGQDGKVLDSQKIMITDDNADAADIIAAKNSIDDAQVKGHVATVRAHQVSEIESMQAYEKMKREELEATKAAEPGAIVTKTNLTSEFTGAVSGHDLAEPLVPEKNLVVQRATALAPSTLTP